MKQSYLFSGAVLALIGKSFITPMLLPEAIVIVALIAITGLCLHYERNKELPINEAVKEQLKALEEDLSLVKNSVSALKFTKLIK